MDIKEFLKVSVIVPIVNEEENICNCLEGLKNQTYPKDKLEIIVVDGMSEDKTREIINDFTQSYSNLNIRILDNPKGQRASALNIGVRNAGGDVILRIDARNQVNADYINRCVDTLLETGADNVGGVQKPLARTVTQKAIGLAMSHPFGIGNAQFRLGRKSGYVGTVYLGCFRKEIFDKVGLFDEYSAIIGEDTDMNHRIRKAGGKVYLNKDIEAYYYPRDSFMGLWKLYFRYGGARIGNVFRSKKFTSWRQLVPPVFLTSVITLILLSLFNHYFVYLLALILGIYLSVDILVSMFLALYNEKLALFSRLLIVFPIMHFAWALGFFARLIQRPKLGEYWGY